jgi:hypothetical protein
MKYTKTYLMNPYSLVSTVLLTIQQSISKTKLGRSGWLKIESGVRQGTVRSPVLFNAMMGGIANKMRGEDRRQGKKTLILAGKILSWRKDGKQAEEKQNLMIKEYELKINMDKTVTMRILRNLDTGLKTKVNYATVRSVNKCTDLESQTNSEEIDGEINKGLRSGSKFYQIVKLLIKEILRNIRDHKTTHKPIQGYFKLILTFNAKT